MRLGEIGVYGPQLRWGDPAGIPDAAAELETLGFGAPWFGDAAPGPIFTDADRLLSASERIVVASGVLNLWMHDAADVVTGHRTLSSRYPGRFLLGIGVSHAPLVDAQQPGTYQRPLNSMRHF